MTQPITLALVPLDERPVNTSYPQMLGRIGGAEVALPPTHIRGRQRQPADVEAVAAWLRGISHNATAAIVSCDFFAYGNLINARISDDSAAEALARMRLLAEINAGCPVHAFSLITRVSNADDAVEEPLYWAQWGTKFYRYARLTHQTEQGALSPAEAAEWDALSATLPPDMKAEWLTRRLRNHTVNLGLLDMAARGQLTSLLLTSDDTSAFGFPTRERDWLGGWPRLIGPALSKRVQMHPGADEVGSALVAQQINAHWGRTPKVWPLYAVAGDEALVAPYEDRPVHETVDGQIAACGCILADGPDDADIVLGVVTPCPNRHDFQPEFLEEDRATRTEPYRRFLDTLGRWQLEGRPLALADVAYPNGADPLFSELLLDPASPLAPGALCAYGAWNTAGNTLGVVVAQAACSLYVGSDLDRALAQKTFLAHRFLEDYGYQMLVRREARHDAEQRWGRREPAPDDDLEQAITSQFIAGRLSQVLGALQSRGIGENLHIEKGSVRLPWRRTFEVDFSLA